MTEHEKMALLCTMATRIFTELDGYSELLAVAAATKIYIEVEKLMKPETV